MPLYLSEWRHTRLQRKPAQGEPPALPVEDEKVTMIADDERRTIFQSLVWLLVGVAALVHGLTAGGVFLVVGSLTFVATLYLGIGMLWVTFVARRRRARHQGDPRG